jgi:hypothetical protein
MASCSPTRNAPSPAGKLDHGRSSDKGRFMCCAEQLAQGAVNVGTDCGAAAQSGTALRAISYMTNGAGQYHRFCRSASSNDSSEAAILNAYEQSRDKDRLLQVARTEKARAAFARYQLPGQLTASRTVAALPERDTAEESAILQHMYNGNADKLQVVRTERIRSCAAWAIQVLASQRTGATAEGWPRSTPPSRTRK